MPGPELACPSPMEECMALLEAITRHPCAWPFLQDPARVLHRHAPKDMNLSAVVSRARTGAYVNPQQLRRDLTHVWRSCLDFNGPDDEATEMVRELAEAFDIVFADRIYGPVRRSCCSALKRRADLVGEAVMLYDDQEFLWLAGRVEAYDEASGLHSVLVEEAAQMYNTPIQRPSGD
mmetsp:Transcript_89860/g.240098  ORF Transcript_89860/g.240098 Transcript_89860/m.240098 type:complete len:177 (+) Transcript_89860:282-812(+)